MAGVTLSASQLVVPGRAGTVTPAKLSPTAHPPVPNDLASMWLVPEQSAKLGPAMTNFVRGVRLLEEDDRAAAALPLVSDGALSTTPVADYARYYTGLALMRLDRYAEADKRVRRSGGAADRRAPSGGCGVSTRRRSAKRRRTTRARSRVYESLVLKKLAQPQLAWLRLGLAADLAGQPMRSVEALQRAYYDFPTTAEADQAGAGARQAGRRSRGGVCAKELARAETLFQARRWTRRKAVVRSRQVVRDRRPIAIAWRSGSRPRTSRSGRHREGRDALRPHLTGPLADEANFHFVTATRGLKLRDEHIALSRAFVEKFPDSPFAEEVLNNLASAYIIDDQDDEADEVFREILNRYPAGRFAERAAWKAGWWAYRQGQFTDALQYFDRGAAQFPRSDYRPSWLYWSGRAAQQAGDIETGVARLRLTATDYHNSYYGRLAVKRLEGERGGAIAPTLQRQPLPSPAIPTAGRIASLLSVGLNREAMSELQYAQRVWGDSPQLQATIARDAQAARQRARRHQRDEARLSAVPRRRRRDAAAEILQVIFPVDYWPLLQKYAKERSLDPYLVAALVAQESNFDPVVVSHANAYGLMQILPSTGRSYARKLGVRPFSTQAIDGGRGQRAPRHADFRGRRSASSAASTSRWPPTTPAAAASSPGSAKSRACRRTSSSTTSRSPRRRTTSSASSGPRRITDTCIANARLTVLRIPHRVPSS